MPKEGHSKERESASYMWEILDSKEGRLKGSNAVQGEARDRHLIAVRAVKHMLNGGRDDPDAIGVAMGSIVNVLAGEKLEQKDLFEKVCDEYHTKVCLVERFSTKNPVTGEIVPPWASKSVGSYDKGEKPIVSKNPVMKLFGLHIFNVRLAKMALLLLSILAVVYLLMNKQQKSFETILQQHINVEEKQVTN